MPWVGFEPTIPGAERAKTVHALDGSATVTDLPDSIYHNNITCSATNIKLLIM
jgi:hypothetical protein